MAGNLQKLYIRHCDLSVGLTIPWIHLLTLSRCCCNLDSTWHVNCSISRYIVIAPLSLLWSSCFWSLVLLSIRPTELCSQSTTGRLLFTNLRHFYQYSETQLLLNIVKILQMHFIKLFQYPYFVNHILSRCPAPIRQTTRVRTHQKHISHEIVDYFAFKNVIIIIAVVIVIGALWVCLWSINQSMVYLLTQHNLNKHIIKVHNNV